jgi:septal ring-binding cell division protein DamX
MPPRLTIAVFVVIVIALFVKPSTVRAETINIPVFIDYQQLQLLMIQDDFKGPNNSARYLLDDNGCTSITFSEPRLSSEGELLRVDAKTLITIGIPTIGNCKAITKWIGNTAVIGKPSLVRDQPLSVRFKVQKARLYDQTGKLLKDGLVLQAVKEQLHLLLSRYKLDLKPETDAFKDMLPYFLPHYPAGRLRRMIDSLRVGPLDLRSNGLAIRLLIDLEPLTKGGSEPILSENEIQRLEQRYQSWDAFLTFVIKEVATATGSQELRSLLLEILLDTRYQFKLILREPQKSADDPVKQLFIQSWERLMPVMREISIRSPEQNLLPYLSFITAADALNALDRLGPTVGLDISADGLRRLARILNNDPSIDPIKYLDEVDPVLQQLFDFEKSGKIIQHKNSHSFNFQLIPPAYAATPRDRLNRWVPNTDELGDYLVEVRNLLLEEADARISSSSIGKEYARIFRKLMLTTAWQESCWRQYIVENRKVVPLISASNDIGMFQINKKVWRGIYSPSKLKWDITYNVRSGSEILFKFMVNYALKQKEHKLAGGLSNLARATYSAYNGGPSQVSRYRKNNVPSEQKKIDTAFWKKYQQVHIGQELAVAQCFGNQASSSTTAAIKIKKGQKTSISKKITTTKKPQRIENVEWIKARNPTHFTIQLAAMSDEQAVKKFIKHQIQAGTFAYYRKNQKGQDLYIAIYGSFANRIDAEKIVDRFAQLKPFIRDFGSIQKIISK